MFEIKFCFTNLFYTEAISILAQEKNVFSSYQNLLNSIILH